MDAEALQLVSLSKEIIKPPSPTPEHMRTLDLSILDQYAPNALVQIIFFYPKSRSETTPFPLISEKLKKSLSRTLFRYYPFAGRIKECGSIECNDKGVEFFEAQANCQLKDIMKQPSAQNMSIFSPVSDERYHGGPETDVLVSIQITEFVCGGMALSACFSHKIADACSISTFMNDWASINNESRVHTSPMFTGSYFFPAVRQISISPLLISPDANCVRRRFTFHGSKVDALKAEIQIRSPKGLTATRFEAIAALICKCVVSTSRSIKVPEPKALCVAVNWRKRMVPALSEYHIGNFAPLNTIPVTGDQADLHNWAALLKEGNARFIEDFAHKDSEHEQCQKIHESFNNLEQLFRCKNSKILLISSWCRFPFYEVDFGYGKPEWVSILPSPTNNCVFLQDTRKADGIEAWVTLEHRTMAGFECDPELLNYATLDRNPLEAYEDIIKHVDL